MINNNCSIQDDKNLEEEINNTFEGLKDSLREIISILKEDKQ